MDLSLVDTGRGKKVRYRGCHWMVAGKIDYKRYDDPVGPDQVIQQFKRLAIVNGTDRYQTVTLKYRLGSPDGIMEFVRGGYYPYTVYADLLWRTELLHSFLYGVDCYPMGHVTPAE